LLDVLRVSVVWRSGLAHVLRLGFGLRDVSRLASVLGLAGVLWPLSVLRLFEVLGRLRSNCGRKALSYRVQARARIRLRTRVLTLSIVVEVGVEVLAIVEGKALGLES
jgi:hypothetical protein